MATLPLPPTDLGARSERRSTDNARFVTNHNIASASTTWTIQGAGDFDGDGDADILWHHQDGRVVTWVMEDIGLRLTRSFGITSPPWQVAGVGEFSLA